ncbi:MAG: DNA mismatch repair protein MutS [Tunicatimonas sp.]
MSPSQPSAVFTQKAAHYQRQASRAAQRFNYLSVVRTLVFVFALVGLVYLANARNDDGFLILFLVFAVGFPALIRYHNRLRQRRDQQLTLKLVNEHELQRLALRFDGFDAGKAFQTSQHSYSGDLDIFGDHSLFQLINRSATQAGKAMLARWLLAPSPKATLLERQEAVQEMEQRTDWRQTFQAYGLQYVASDENLATLLTWMNEPPALKRPKLYQGLCYGLALLATLAIILYFTTALPGYVVIGLLAINGIILWTTAEVALVTHRKTAQSVAVLRAYQHMFVSVEGQSFTSPLLQRIREELYHQGVPASRQISRLRYILENFDARANLFYHIFNVVLLLDVSWLLQADRWKQRVQGDVAQWFAGMSQVEALSSIASFAFAHPTFAFPTISDQRFRLSAQGLGHCLIPSAQRVANDFVMQDRGTITIITGSNMSGKSTFLRTVGVNVVLALAGAPVCAERFEVSVLQVFTSMRTQDSLEENVSSFYAELRRLRQLLDLLQAPEVPVLFMLDEILKGTNSQDRHHGAASLIKQLSQLEATGFVSTHDLELGKLEESLLKVKNYSFTSTIEQDEIHFDYQLREGVCQSFNASKLMAKMGIALEE